jgi:maltooligosyltrehalose trehalohydrolase
VCARSSEGGYGLDALWNDDFHHSARRRAHRPREAYYTDYLGTPQELISAAKYGYLYQGQRYRWQKKRAARRPSGPAAGRVRHFLQNHDQVANSARGARCTS